MKGVLWRIRIFAKSFHVN